jgi:hypothetical protein
VKSFSNTSNLPLAQAPTLRRGLVALHLRTWSRWPGRLGSRPLLKIIVVRQRTLAPALPPEATLSATWGRAGGGGVGGGGCQFDGARPAPRHVWGEGARVCLHLYLGGRCCAALALARGGRRLISLLRLGGDVKWWRKGKSNRRRATRAAQRSAV